MIENLEYLKSLINKEIYPPPSSIKIRHSKFYIQHGVGPKGTRSIFVGFPYTEPEQKAIKELKTYIEKNNLKIPSFWNDSDLLKMIYTGGFTLSKTVECVTKHTKWINDPKYHTLPPLSLKIINEKYLFSIGKDRQFRPIVYCNLQKIATMSDKEIEECIGAGCCIMSAIRGNSFLPGYIENWTILVDTSSLSVFGFPFKAMKKIAKITSLNYTCTVHKIFFLNPSFSFNAIFTFGKSVSHPDTVSKMKLLKKNQYHEMFQDIDKSQLLEEYGGTLKCPASLWPIPNTLPQNVQPINDNQAMAENNVPNVNYDGFWDTKKDSQPKTINAVAKNEENKEIIIQEPIKNPISDKIQPEIICNSNKLQDIEEQNHHKIEVYDKNVQQQVYEEENKYEQKIVTNDINLVIMETEKGETGNKNTAHLNESIRSDAEEYDVFKNAELNFGEDHKSKDETLTTPSSVDHVKNTLAKKIEIPSEKKQQENQEEFASSTPKLMGAKIEHTTIELSKDAKCTSCTCNNF